jgi:hypothetical protein
VREGQLFKIESSPILEGRADSDSESALLSEGGPTRSEGRLGTLDSVRALSLCQSQLACIVCSGDIGSAPGASELPRGRLWLPGELHMRCLLLLRAYNAGDSLGPPGSCGNDGAGACARAGPAHELHVGSPHGLRASQLPHVTVPVA